MRLSITPPKAMTTKTGPRSGEGWRISTKFRGKGPHPRRQGFNSAAATVECGPSPDCGQTVPVPGGEARDAGRADGAGMVRRTPTGIADSRPRRVGYREQPPLWGARPGADREGDRRGERGLGKGQGHGASSGATGSSDRGTPAGPRPGPPLRRLSRAPAPSSSNFARRAQRARGAGGAGERAESGGVPRPQAGRPPRSASGSRAPRLPAAGPRSRAAPAAAAAVLQALTSLRGLRFLPSFAHRSARGPAPRLPPPLPRPPAPGASPAPSPRPPRSPPSRPLGGGRGVGGGGRAGGTRKRKRAGFLAVPSCPSSHIQVGAGGGARVGERATAGAGPRHPRPPRHEAKPGRPQAPGGPVSPALVGEDRQRTRGGGTGRAAPSPQPWLPFLPSLTPTSGMTPGVLTHSSRLV